MSLKVFLTGRVAVEVDGRAVDEDRFAGRQGRLVFACLVLANGQAVPHEELAAAVWGESPPASWRKALTVIVSKVRALLAECGIDATSVLTSAFGCYRLDLPPGSRVDVLEAIESEEAAAKALAAGELEAANDAARRSVEVTRRQFLPGDEGGWVDAKRRELSDVLCRALTCLADAALRSGRFPEAATWAEEVTVLEPFRETGYRRLMEAHAAAGNRAEALRVYERCRVLLAEELGAYPSPETESIYRRLLDAPVPDPMPERADPDPAPAVEPSVPAARSKQRRFRVAVAALVTLAVAAVIAVIAVRVTDEENPTLARVQGNAVGVVDLQSRAIVAEAPEIASPQRVAAGAGSVWVTSSGGGGSVVRLDPKSHAVTDTIDVGNGPVGIAVGAGAVWVANSLDGTVSRIDPATGREVGDPIEVGNMPTGVAYGAGAVWVTNAGDRSVSKIDPMTGVVLSTTDVGAAARWIAVGGGAVWVTDPVGNKLVRIDARSGEPTDPIAVGSGPTAVAYGNGAVWVTNSLAGTLSRIDPRRATVTNTIPVGISPNGIDVSTDGVWVIDEVGGTLVHLDRASGKTTVTRLGGRPEGVAIADGSLWIAVQAAGATHRGGTVRMFGFIDSVDPAEAFLPEAPTFLSVVFDGLVGYKRVGGVDGSTLVPDLASALPEPTDNGKAYTFRLRKGIKFSDGRALKASDVRYSLERMFKANPAKPEFYEGILGGAACKKRPRDCDLSTGVVADDDTGMVTIRLRAPDPDFLHKLALPWASILPTGTPARGKMPIAGTGPYQVAEHEPGRRLRLVRNPHFEVWSKPAQPEGIPDEILLDSTTDPDAALTAVQRERADISHVLPDRLQEVRTRYASQLHVTPRATVYLLALNTARPPFDDARARRAVAFAVDRARLVRGFGGSDIAAPACQLLPPGLPGYRRYCPYTVRPTEGGAWAGPDLARARDLVAQSGTKGMRVDVLGYGGEGPFAALTTVLDDTLRQLGYRTSMKRMPEVDSYFEAFNVGAARVEAAFQGWFADYPATGGFLPGLLACGGAPLACNDPAVDRRIRRAIELQARNPEAANDAWARLDRDVVDKAIMVPVITENALDFVSKRVGNYQRHPVYGILISQLWVRRDS